jgi:HEAT repeat protein
VGSAFKAHVNILAGAPQSLADLAPYLDVHYDPITRTTSNDPLDRYAGAKALRFRPDLNSQAPQVLAALLALESEPRVALEASGSAASFDMDEGYRALSATLNNEERVDLSMEAILILTELRTPQACEYLSQSAKDFTDERRQAAIWGLGKAGAKSYVELLPYIADDDEEVAMHAIAAFGDDTPKIVLDRLVAILRQNDVRRSAAASEALRVIASPVALECLIAGLQGCENSDWIVATIGRMPPTLVRERLNGTPLLASVQPMLLVAHGASWLATDDAVTDMAFLLKQTL